MPTFPEPGAPELLRLELDAAYRIGDLQIAPIMFGLLGEGPRESNMVPGGVAPDIFAGYAAPGGSAPVIIAASPSDKAIG
ncbi:hypothetical protein [Sphingomonas crusticola]|uniref:hypothetical protein n=1 Tax=Sphingomonas crusticola TaxID=1697973 RepID=UPI0013C2E6D2|nr:hypothetical protein [Sphingomonas crusticola]